MGIISCASGSSCWRGLHYYKNNKVKKLKEINCIDDNTKIYGTHISHDGMSYHEEIEKRAIENGYNIAYDGMELEI